MHLQAAILQKTSSPPLQGPALPPRRGQRYQALVVVVAGLAGGLAAALALAALVR